MRDMPESRLQTVESPSSLSAWLYLVRLSWQRQARVRYMVWISLALLAFTAIAVLVQTFSLGWSLERARPSWRTSSDTYEQVFARLEVALATGGVLGSAPMAALGNGIMGSAGAVLRKTDFINLSRGIF